MEAAIATLALFVFGGLATYRICERRHRSRWFRFARRPVAERHSPFRHPAGPPTTRAVLVRRQAPQEIRRTALWSIYMGQMAIPGGALGLFGLAACGIGLVSIPGMILAIRIWRLGYAMLRRDPGAADEARKLTRFAVVLNLVAIAVAFVLTVVEPMFVILLLVLGFYAMISFVHAYAMYCCAELLDRLADEECEVEVIDPASDDPPARIYR